MLKFSISYWWRDVVTYPSTTTMLFLYRIPFLRDMIQRQILSILHMFFIFRCGCLFPKTALNTPEWSLPRELQSTGLCSLCKSAHHNTFYFRFSFAGRSLLVVWFFIYILISYLSWMLFNNNILCSIEQDEWNKYSVGMSWLASLVHDNTISPLEQVKARKFSPQ